MKSPFTRKQFLKISSGFTAAVTFGFPNLILPRRKEKLGVALVGLGRYSNGLLRPGLRITEHCELKGVVTGSPEKIPDWQGEFGFPDRNIYNYENVYQIADNDALANKEGRPPHVPGEEGLADVRVVQAIMESSRRGGVRVEV